MILLFYHDYGLNYGEKFKEFIEDWKNLIDDYKHILSSQFSLELKIDRNNVYDCLNSLNNFDFILEKLDSFVKNLTMNLKNSIMELNFNESINLLGNVPLFEKLIEDIDNLIAPSIEKSWDILQKGTIILKSENRVDNIIFISLILKKYFKKSIFLKEKHRGIMNWLMQDSLIITKNYIPEYPIPNLISIVDSSYNLNLKLIEFYGPIKFYLLNSTGNHVVLFEWQDYTKDLILKFLRLILPEEKWNLFEEGGFIDKFSKLHFNTISEIYLFCKTFSIMLEEINPSELINLLEIDAKKYYIEHILNKYNKINLLIIYIGTKFPIDEIIIKNFNIDTSIFEKIDGEYIIPQEISEELKKNILEFQNFVSYINEIAQEAKSYVKNLINNMEIPYFKDNINLVIWYTLITNGVSSLKLLTKILPSLEYIYSYLTPLALLKEKGKGSYAYTPLLMSLNDKNFYSIPFIFKEYGRESPEGKIIISYFNSLHKLNLMENTNLKILEYINNSVSSNDDEFYHFFAGANHLEKGDFENAIKEFDISIEKNHIFFDSYILKAIAIYELEKSVISLGKKKELLESALKELNNSLAINNELYFSHYLKGVILLKEVKIENNRIRKKGLLDLALKEFENGISLNKDFPLLYSGKGECLYQFGLLENEIEKRKEFFENALKIFSDVCEIDPKIRIAIYGKGNCYYELSKLEFSLNSKNILLLNALQEYDLLIQFYDDPLAHNGKGNVYLILSRFNRNENERLKNIEMAIKEYEKSMKMDERIVENYVGLGNAYLEIFKNKSGKDKKIDLIKKALDYFNLGLNLDPLNTYLHNGKAEGYLEMSRITVNKDEKVEFLKISLEEFEKCIKTDGEFIHAYNGIGNVFIDLYKIESDNEKRDKYLKNAIKNFENALSINSKYSLSYNGLSICYALMSKNIKNKEKKKMYIYKSIEEIDKSISYDPLFSFPYHNMGNRLLDLANIENNLNKKMEFLEKAIKKYEESISLNPSLKYSYAGMGDCYRKMALIEKDKKKRKNFLEQAIKQYESAISLDKDFENARKNLELCKALIYKYKI
ncbi:MAG: hypothetical protein QW627_03315 [Thermoplasmata archaeon]